MKITIRLPGWAWIARLLDRNFPETSARAQTFGKAKSHREWLKGAFQASVEVEKPKE